MAVFVSGINYKYRIRDHYNALNEMSDWSPEERDRIKNKRIHPMVTRSMTRKSRESMAFLPVEGEEPEETLRKFLEAKKGGDARYRDLLNELYPSGTAKRSSRVKRGAKSAKRARNFSFDKLINHDPTPEPIKKPVRVGSKNPNRKLVAGAGRSLRDQIEVVEFLTLEDAEEGQEDSGSIESPLESKFSSLNIGDSNASESGGDLRDAIFVDYRDSPCMNKVRSQGKCGSCYAFAAMTIVEWLYCTRKGLLVDFSEQYMVDCGLDNIDGMFACEGATVDAVYNFVHNFGVELRSRYPYKSRNGTCPYGESTNLKAAGYIRMDLSAFISIPIENWPEALQREPLYIMIQLVEDFYEYGGGVYDGAQCLANSEDMDDLHSVVLVGHGREDGEEFWLIRNSHGRDWGERGYYKLSKAASNCVYTETGFALTWKDDLKVRPYRNRHHDDTILAGKATKRRDKKKKSARN